MVEAATRGTEIKETAHARSGTNDTMTSCVNTAPLSDQQKSDGVNISATAVKVPTAIANRTATTASREADTQVKGHDGFDEQAQGPISTSVVHRGEGTVYGRTGGRDCNDGAARVQGNHAKTRTATQDDDFPPLSEKISRTSLRPKASQLRKKKRLYSTRKRPRLDNAVAAAGR
jgi:hypothetical protein